MNTLRLARADSPDPVTLAYPSGLVLTYTYDSAGRPSDAVDTTNSINYAVGSCSNGAASPTTGACYAPQGALSQLKDGTNLVSTYLFNTRLQPCWMYATTGTALATNTACNAADPGSGNILDLQYNFNSGHDNGNVIGITNNRSGQTGRTQSFTYDQVNRIVSGQTTATTGSTCWGETYTLDQWANLSAIGAVSGYTGCTQDNLSVTVTTNNQLSSTGFVYDAAGNMTSDNTYTYGYNAESEIKSAAGVNYVYDAEGNRVAKLNSTQYIYGPSGEILTETNSSGTFTNEYVFFGGKRIAMRNIPSGNIYYYEEDMLGSSRTMVQAGQTSVCFDADFLPFGYEKDVTTTCTQNYKFEGKERDTETNNDDFGARYYTFRLGRWLSADWSSVPAPVPYANLTNPQTLNLYSMVSDNPESFADLDGHDGITSACTTGPGGSISCKSNPSDPVNVPAKPGEGTPNTGDGTAPSPAQQAGQGAAITAGAMLTNDAAVRANYAEQASQLSGPDASAARTALQQDSYEQLSPVGQAVTDVLKQSRTEQLAGKTAEQLAESASKTSEAVNAAGAMARAAGPALLVAGATMSAYNIAHAPKGQRARAAAGEAGAWAGALTVGALGAKAGAVVGSFFGPGPGTAIGAGVGALVGGGVGAIVGSKLGRAIYDHL